MNWPLNHQTLYHSLALAMALLPTEARLSPHWHNIVVRMNQRIRRRRQQRLAASSLPEVDRAEFRGIMQHQGRGDSDGGRARPRRNLCSRKDMRSTKIADSAKLLNYERKPQDANSIFGRLPCSMVTSSDIKFLRVPSSGFKDTTFMAQLWGFPMCWLISVREHHLGVLHCWRCC